MKKILLLFVGMLLTSISFSQDTITGYLFPVNSGPDSLNANLGLQLNMVYAIQYAGADTVYNTIYHTTGIIDHAATASGWDNGAAEKHWVIEFKAENFKNMKVSSRQKSGETHPGPKDFKLQYSVGAGNWEDIPGGTVTVANDWNTGQISDLPVPVSNQGNSTVYIRWIMTSDTSSTGSTIQPEGISKIDEIVVTGTSTLGVNEILYATSLNISPNPNSGSCEITSPEPLDKLMIFDMNGRNVYQNDSPGLTTRLNLTLPPGIYIVTAQHELHGRIFSKRLVIR